MKKLAVAMGLATIVSGYAGASQQVKMPDTTGDWTYESNKIFDGKDVLFRTMETDGKIAEQEYILSMLKCNENYQKVPFGVYDLKTKPLILISIWMALQSLYLEMEAV